MKKIRLTVTALFSIIILFTAFIVFFKLQTEAGKPFHRGFEGDRRQLWQRITGTKTTPLLFYRINQGYHLRRNKKRSDSGEDGRCANLTLKNLV